MANNRYGENDNEAGGTASLAEKVKGTKEGAPSFKEMGSEKDDSKADPNATGVSLPHSSTKVLPK